MVLSEEVALLCVAREEDEGKREGGIEGRVSDEATDGIARHAYVSRQESAPIDKALCCDP